MDDARKSGRGLGGDSGQAEPRGHPHPTHKPLRGSARGCERGKRLSVRAKVAASIVSSGLAFAGRQTLELAIHATANPVITSHRSGPRHIGSVPLPSPKSPYCSGASG